MGPCGVTGGRLTHRPGRVVLPGVGACKIVKGLLRDSTPAELGKEWLLHSQGEARGTWTCPAEAAVAAKAQT